MISFYLNGRLTQEQEAAPDVTVLRYLRTRPSLVGTKEGCASGDCGACTVLMGSFDQNKWTYQAVNSCITFLTQIHGKNLITVEALAGQHQLHPAQQSMVDHHASQCGFCTPGIVMSLAALHRKSAKTKANIKDSDGIIDDIEETLSHTDILDALSGNLCRCTGYQPIINAAKAMHSYPDTSQPAVWEPETKLNTHHASGSGLESTSGRSWVVSSESELKELLNDHPEARLVAGATDLALEVTQAQHTMDKLIAISSVPSLCNVTVYFDHILFGTAAPFSKIEPVLHTHFPEFGAMTERLGSRQIRNLGTLGGNIGNASPIGDTPPVLIALNAQIELASIKGNRWLSLEEFFLGYKKTALKPGEYIRAIKAPRLNKNQVLKVYKISKRLEDDISAVLTALNLTIENGLITAVRSGFGGMAEIPKAAKHLEQALLGQPVSTDTFIHAGEQLTKDFNPISDVRASADYRIQVVKGLLRKCALEINEPEKLTRIEQVYTATLVDEIIGDTTAKEARHG